jgi:glycosyltransferase involved in cell wall biosynthesis
MQTTSPGVLGFACNWDPVPQRTWSGTAWHLWQALGGVMDCPDVGVHLPVTTRRALQLATRRRRNGAWVSTWEHSRIWQGVLQQRVRQRASAFGCDAVLEIQDIAVIDRPFFVYQDLSYDVLIAQRQQDDTGVAQYFRTINDRTLKRRRERQLQIYDQAAGVIAMSKWFAERLVQDTGLASEKVHVAYPGATSLLNWTADGQSLTPRSAPRRRLLFLGTSFMVKGGDVVLEALRLVRAQDPRITLTVAGPSTWPLPSAPPPGVDFVGNVPRDRVLELLDTHDLLVMPSRLEGFGIVFVEAMARGLPCIGRRAFAMPELIEDGVTGALVESDDPAALAQAISTTLADDSIFDEVCRRAPLVSEQFSWQRTAQTIRDIVRQSVTV